MRAVLLAAIRFYQSFISPYKGFRCAYHADTGCASCSVLGYRAVRRYGVVQGLSVLRGRFDKCARASQRYRRRPAHLQAQAGFCELLIIPDVIGTLACSGLPDACACFGSKAYDEYKEQERDRQKALPPQIGEQ